VVEVSATTTSPAGCSRRDGGIAVYTPSPSFVDVVCATAPPSLNALSHKAQAAHVGARTVGLPGEGCGRQHGRRIHHGGGIFRRPLGFGHGDRRCRRVAPADAVASVGRSVGAVDSNAADGSPTEAVASLDARLGPV